MKPPLELYTVDETCEKLRMEHPSAHKVLVKWAREGRIRGIRRGREILFSRAAIEDYLDRQTIR